MDALLLVVKLVFAAVLTTLYQASSLLLLRNWNRTPTIRLHAKRAELALALAQDENAVGRQ
jgi:hypothetical protein